MPLSEHEQRQLKQIEEALRAGDPRFANAIHAADPRVHYKRRLVAAAVAFVVGVGLLFAGVAINVVPIAVAGFAGMLTSSMWAVDSYRRMTGRIPAQGVRPDKERRAAKSQRSGKQTGSGLMGRLEERWRHRQQGGR